MKKVVLSCAAFGILFTFLAWLLSILLIDVFIGREDWMSQHMDILDDIELELDASNERQAAIQELSEYYDASIIEFNSNNSAQSTTTLDEKDAFYAIDLTDGTSLEVGLNYVETPFITQADWLQLFLHAIAILCTLWVTLTIFERQLRPLTAAAKGISPNGTDDQHTDKDSTSIPSAVNALTSAKNQIEHLKDAEKLAIEHHRDLLASVAHEFRNPLARLQFAIELAAERTGDEQHALFEEANIAAVELDALVRETLHYSRLINNGNALTLDGVSILDVFRTVSDLQPGTRAEIKLILDYPTNDILLLADKRLLTRALTNLVTNALKYADNEVCVTINTDSTHAFISIIDDGDGIDQLHAERIFEPFYRIERSRSRDTGGFGLGLSIVSSICQQHNATITLQQTEKGAHFLLGWPLSTS